MPDLLQYSVTDKVRHTPSKEIDYAIFLKNYSLSFQPDGLYYCIGKIHNSQHAFFISLSIADLCPALHLLLPLLEKTGLPFKLVRNTATHAWINNGGYGNDNIGKIIIVFPSSKSDRLTMLSWAKISLKVFTGPDLHLYTTIGPNLYDCALMLLNKQNKTPNKRYINRYLFIRLLRSTPKGEIYQAIDFPSLRLCIVKRGRHCAFEDRYGRNIRDRLRWQLITAQLLQGKGPVPKVLDYIEKQSDTYLVLEYIEGISVKEQVFTINPAGNTFKEIEPAVQKSLLYLYLAILQSVQALHSAGVVHRDINDANLLVTPGGLVVIIDLEMAFSLDTRLPDPVFFPGASQYRAPEQGDFLPVDCTEDIFSLGCLLYNFLTMKQPPSFYLLDPEAIENQLLIDCPHPSLAALCVAATDPDPMSRPALTEMITKVQAFITT